MEARPCAHRYGRLARSPPPRPDPLATRQRMRMTTSAAGGRGEARLLPVSDVPIDDRPYILARERGRQHAALEAVHDLQLLAEARPQEVLDDDALDGEIGQ